MVKPPRIRHSKPRREPVTLDLKPEKVTGTEKPAATPEAAPSRQTAPGAATPLPDAPETGAAPSRGPAKTEAVSEPTPPKEATAKPSPAVPPSGAKEQVGAAVSSQGQPSAAPRPGTAGGKPPEAPQDPPRGGATGSGASSGFGRDATPPRSRQSSVSAIAAGLVGGALALLIGVALNYAGYLPGRETDAQRADRALVESLRGEIEVLREQVGTAEAAPGDDVAERLDGFSSALEQVTAELAALRETGVAEGTAEVDLAPLQARLGEIEARLASIGSEVAETGPLDALTGQITALEAAMAEAAQSESARIAALEQALADLGSTVEEQASQPQMALAIAASALKAAIDRGTPFSAELDTYEAVAPDAAAIEPLREFAAEGVPTRAAILGEAPAAAQAMIDATRPVDADAGFLDRLLASAESLIEVRPVGEVAGEGVPETVARMEAALGEDDYPRAIAEFETLPEAARAAGQDFIGKVRARQAADELIGSALAEALRPA